MKTTLQRVINTLGEIEVKGRANLDRLLGAILALEKVVAQIQMDERGDVDATDDHD